MQWTWSEFEERLTRPGEVLNLIIERGRVVVQDVPDRSPQSLGVIITTLAPAPLDIDPEHSGPAVMAIAFDDTKTAQDARPAYFTNDHFPLHTDLCSVVNAPRFMGTLCAHPGRAGEGIQLYRDMADAWRGLTDADRTALSTIPCGFRRPPNTGPGEPIRCCVCEIVFGEPVFRWRSDSTIVPDELKPAFARFSDLIGQHVLESPPRAGELVLVDNHRWVHGRTPFSPDSNRLIFRAYGQDPTRSRALLDKLR